MDKMNLILAPQLSLSKERLAKIARYANEVDGGKRNSPVSMQVALTDSCFNRCIGCGHPDREQRRMEHGMWLQFLEDLPTLPESVCYSGGDPMAYPYFNEVMQWHVDNNVKFGCTITGYVPKRIDMSLMAKAFWIRVSLDALDAEVYAKVRGKTPLAKVLKSIDDMLEANVNVELGITMHPDNEGELPALREWAAAKGITEIFAHYVYPQSNPMWEDIELEDRGVMSFNTCKAVFYQLYIDSDGSVYPCCITAGDTRASAQSNTLGNLFVDSWPVIWDNVVAYSQIEKACLPEVCSTCCVKRLSEINHVHDYLVDNTQSFF